jgi:hypothetical protein
MDSAATNPERSLSIEQHQAIVSRRRWRDDYTSNGTGTVTLAGTAARSTPPCWVWLQQHRHYNGPATLTINSPATAR